MNRNQSMHRWQRQQPCSRRRKPLHCSSHQTSCHVVVVVVVVKRWKCIPQGWNVIECHFPANARSKQETPQAHSGRNSFLTVNLIYLPTSAFWKNTWRSCICELEHTKMNNNMQKCLQRFWRGCWAVWISLNVLRPTCGYRTPWAPLKERFQMLISVETSTHSIVTTMCDNSPIINMSLLWLWWMRWRTFLNSPQCCVQWCSYWCSDKLCVQWYSYWCSDLYSAIKLYSVFGGTVRNISDFLMWMQRRSGYLCSFHEV